MTVGTIARKQRQNPSRRRSIARRVAAAGLALALGVSLAPSAEAASAPRRSAALATVRGCLIDEDKRPVPGMTVVHSMRWASARTTNAAGCFTMTGVPARKQFTLFFEEDGTYEGLGPGVKVYLGGSTKASAAKQLKLKPGETRNLGRIRITFVTNPSRSRTAVKTSSKAAVRSTYKTLISRAAVRGKPTEPNGCAVSATPRAVQDDTIAVVSAFRALAGLDPVTLDTRLSAKALKSSIIQYYLPEVTHTPSTSAKCSTAVGRKAAAASDLYKGSRAGQAVRIYMKDPGEENKDAPHRRWILKPSTTTMGTADVGKANTLYVQGLQADGRATPAYIPWPSAGYFPAQEEPGGRWSVSAGRKDVSFARARVTVKTSAGRSLKVHRYTPADRIALPTLVFDVEAIPRVSGTKVVSLTVEVTGITRRGIALPAHTYTVKLFEA